MEKKLPRRKEHDKKMQIRGLRYCSMLMDHDLFTYLLGIEGSHEKFEMDSNKDVPMANVNNSQGLAERGNFSHYLHPDNDETSDKSKLILNQQREDDDDEEEEEGGILNFLFRRSTRRKSKKKISQNEEQIHVIERTEGPRRSLRQSIRRLFRRSESFSRAQNENDIIGQVEVADVSAPAIETRSDNATESQISTSAHEDTLIAVVDDASIDGGIEQRPSVRFTYNRVDIPILLTPPSPPRNRPVAMNLNQGIVLRNVLLNATTDGAVNEPIPSNPPAESSNNGSRSRVPRDDEPTLPFETDEERSKRVGFWPHAPCSLLAVLACTLGMGNMCRFSFLCFQYGGGFILQFIMLSVTFGFPMISFFMSVGQYTGSGIMDMWRISPFFQGVGVASLIATTLIGIYTIIPVSWLFVYFRDSFITNGYIFKWGECSSIFKGEFNGINCRRYNSSQIFRKTVPEYFHGRVLQRSNLHPVPSTFGELKFENVFNLAVVWMLIFICLSKGLKSYGKVVFVFAFFPLIGILLVSVELLRQAENGTEYIMNMNTMMWESFTSGASWIAAAREVFFTWGIHGAVIMQITSHNRFKHNIIRDSTVVILVTFSTLLVVGFLSCACFAIIFKHEGGSINFLASSFETERNLLFLAPNPDPKIPLQLHWSNNLLLGEEMMTSHMDSIHESNYQVFRLVTELFPAAVANLGANRISPFWSVLFYLTLITFALAQQLAIWRCAIEGIIAIKPKVLRSWETTITFIMCVMGFVLGLPATTEVGIFVIYFLDFCIGSAWWIMIIYLVMMLAVLVVRGKPYRADNLVSLLTSNKFSRKWLSNVISFSWTVIVPAILLILSITSFRNGKYSRIFNWYDNRGYRYWPTWVRQIGTFIQICPLLAIPLIGCIQTCRYLAKGPTDLFDRLQTLYRPNMRTPPDGQQTDSFTRRRVGLENPGFTEDPPPKYTPPPSYNTATGLKLLKRLNSLRRSLRSQFPGRSSTSTSNVGVVELSSQQTGNSSSDVLMPSVFILTANDLHEPSTSNLQTRINSSTTVSSLSSVACFVDMLHFVTVSSEEFVVNPTKAYRQKRTTVRARRMNLVCAEATDGATIQKTRSGSLWIVGRIEDTVLTSS
uniref:Transporter n=1 Tax=Strigamia maritima TaxID=126957 RepID=T1IY39_STRMM